MLNSPVAVVTVPESQLFTVQQPQQVDAIQHEADMPNDEDVTGRAPNELTINVDITPSSAGLTQDAVLADGTPNSTPADPKASAVL